MIPDKSSKTNSSAAASGERQLRILQFKSKISNLRATSKIYTIHNEDGTEDGSINTLDSSLATSTVVTSTSAAGQARGLRNEEHEAGCNNGVVVEEVEEEEQKRSPLESSERELVDDYYTYDKRTSSGTTTTSSVAKQHYNPFLDSSSDEEEEEEAESEAVEKNEESTTKKLHSSNPFIDSDSEEQSSTKSSINKQSQANDSLSKITDNSSLDTTTKETMKLMNEMNMELMNEELLRANCRNTMSALRSLEDDKKKKKLKGKGEEKLERPSVLAQRALSEMSNTGETNGSSTMGGFSIESVQEEESEEVQEESFEEEESTTEEVVAQLTAAATKTINEARKQINPFMSDDEEDDDSSAKEYMPAILKTDKPTVNDKELTSPLADVSFDETSDSVSTITKAVESNCCETTTTTTKTRPELGRKDSNLRLRRVLQMSKELVEDGDGSNSPTVMVNKYSLGKVELDETSAVDTDKEEEETRKVEMERVNAANEDVVETVDEKKTKEKIKRRITPANNDGLSESSQESDEPWLQGATTTTTPAASPNRHRINSSMESNFTELYLADSESTAYSTDEHQQDNYNKANNPFADLLQLRQIERHAAADAESNESTSTTPSIDDEQSLDSKGNKNPFAELLRLRQMRKMAMQRVLHHKESVGSVNLDDSSNEDTSMSSKSLEQSLANKKNDKFPLVYCNTEEGEDKSMDGVLFSDLKKALSTLPSVSIEEESAELEDDVKEKVAEHAMYGYHRSEAIGGGESFDHIAPPVIVKDANSCAVSSIKDESFAITKLLKDKKSPKKEASQVHLMVASSDSTEEAVAATPPLPTTGGESVNTPLLSNTPKPEYHNGEEREDVNISPPRKGVVLNSDDSISTKDSILGKTINVANKDLVAERIFLESLRAQVHAELKVHVADEEIRQALDARLHAIQDYYKRKSTVMSLRKDTPTLKLGDLPEVKPALVSAMSIEDENTINNTNVMVQRQNSYKFAFDRVQGTIDEAIRAAHNVPGHEEEDEEEATTRQVPVGIDIFAGKDTLWDEPITPGAIELSPPEGSDVPPPTHTQTIYNAWNYYRSINSLIFDSRVYDYEFEQIQTDPLYPYLKSLMGIADGGEDGYSNEHKRISQKVKREYDDMSPHRISHILAEEAEAALPELKTICAYIGSKLGMQTMAVGPTKKPSEALVKSEKKYGGDPLLVTDYCRVSLFVKDIASLLALIEIVLSKYAGIVRRIKLSSLKADHVSLIGGYRDCKINLDINGHICEIQVHLISMWLIMEGKGYTHYRECCEHNVDMSCFDIGNMLKGLDRKTLADLIKMGEHELKNYPIVDLKQYNETQIRDYFALATLYLYYGIPSRAECILRRTVKLRSDASEFGPNHAETLLHLELLFKTLKHQHRYKSASAVKSRIRKVRQTINPEEDTQLELVELCKTDPCGANMMLDMCDMILDPSKKERLEEKQKADTVDDSRALWLTVRKSFFS